MNKKTIIQLVIIVVAFGVAGVVLYNGFFKTASVPLNLVATSATTAGASGAILPNGESLDFSKAIDPKRFQYNQITYTQLDPKNDLGILKENLVIPLPVVTTGGH
jgi:hypothetical protein